MVRLSTLEYLAWRAKQPNHYRAQAAATRARRGATFDALLASMHRSVLGLEIALHKVSRHQLEEAANG